jgi:hypothetical protein
MAVGVFFFARLSILEVGDIIGLAIHWSCSRPRSGNTRGCRNYVFVIE